jgi:hypothetical protein
VLRVCAQKLYIVHSIIFHIVMTYDDVDNIGRDIVCYVNELKRAIQDATVQVEATQQALTSHSSAVQKMLAGSYLAAVPHVIAAQRSVTAQVEFASTRNITDAHTAGPQTHQIHRVLGNVEDALLTAGPSSVAQSAGGLSCKKRQVDMDVSSLRAKKARLSFHLRTPLSEKHSRQEPEIHSAYEDLLDINNFETHSGDGDHMEILFRRDVGNNKAEIISAEDVSHTMN